MNRLKEAIDEIDKDILRILQEDSKTSYREIQDILKISIGTIHNRISKLVKKGIIEGYTLKLNNEKLGFKLTFLIRISIDGKHTEEVLNEIGKIPEVCSIFHTTGDHSAALICRFSDSEDVHKFIKELNEKPYVIRTVSNMVLREYKNTAFVEMKKKEREFFKNNKNIRKK